MIGVHRASGGGAINETVIVPVGSQRDVVSVELHLSAAPTTAGYFYVTKDSGEGAAYDTVAYKVDPSATSMTDLVWQPEQPYILIGGDAIDVTYANADGRTWGLIITTRGV